MTERIEYEIMERIKQPGWVTTRGVLLDPSGEKDEEEHLVVEATMRRLAREGKVRLWRLVLQNEPTKLMAASGNDLKLDEILAERGAWARAEPLGIEDNL